jgi:DNA polymerase-3 subunit epsilon
MYNVPLFFFDLETTGLDVDTCGIVQMAYLKLGEGDETQWEDSATLLMNPQTHIDERASAVHGFTDEMVADKPIFDVFADSLYGLADGAYWVGYNNMRYDIPVFKNHFKRCGHAVPKPAGIIDSYKIFTHFYGKSRTKGSRTLQAAHCHYCGDTFDDAHDAMADIRATYRVLSEQIDEHQDLLTLEKAVKISQQREANIDHRGFFKFGSGNVPVCAVGKFAGVAIKDVPAGYLSWIANNNTLGDDTRKIAKNALIGVYPIWKD